MAYKYTTELLQHFENPKNLGALKDYTLKNSGYNEKDGDWIEFYLLIQDGILEDVGYLVKGCPRAIASSSYTSVLIKGKKIEDILNINDASIRQALGLEDPKFKCVAIPLKIVQDVLKKFI